MTTTPSVTTDVLRRELDGAPTPDGEPIAVVQARIDDILRPKGALRRLDELAIWLAGWQRSGQPSIIRPAAIIFAADHGVTTEGVSAYPADVTAAMVRAFDEGVASVCALGAATGTRVEVCDVGVGRPTGNLRVVAAMDQARFDEAFLVGRESVASLAPQPDLLIVGEMGIGNTTAAAAVCCALLNRAPTLMTGSGTGVDGSALTHKQRVVGDAVGRVGEVDDPLTILRELGGAELVAMAGAMVEARMQSIPMLLDGYIATTPALVLHAVAPGWLNHARAGHRSAEPGHHVVLEHLGLEPLLDLDLRLGEASGAMAALPLLKMACALVNDVATFTEFFGLSADAS